MKVAITMRDGTVTRSKSVDASYTIEDCGAVSVWVSGQRVYSVAAGEWVSVGQAKKEPQS